MKHCNLWIMSLTVCVLGFMSPSWALPDATEQASSKVIKPANIHTTQTKSAVSSQKPASSIDQSTDMSTEQQQEMQMDMDRRSKVEQGISNTMKKESDTSDAVIQNMK